MSYVGLLVQYRVVLYFKAIKTFPVSASPESSRPKHFYRFYWSLCKPERFTRRRWRAMKRCLMGRADQHNHRCWNEFSDVNFQPVELRSFGLAPGLSHNIWHLLTTSTKTDPLQLDCISLRLCLIKWPLRVFIWLLLVWQCWKLLCTLSPGLLTGPLHFVF